MEQNNQLNFEKQKELVDAILAWMSHDNINLLVNVKPRKILDLQCGTIFIEILNQIDDQIFDTKQVQDQNDSTIIYQNIKYVLDGLFQFYTQKPQLKKIDEQYINLEIISQVIEPNQQNEKNEKNFQVTFEIIKLSELILAAVVYSKENQRFISCIQDLDTDYQTTLTFLIEQRLAEDNYDNNKDQNQFNNDALYDQIDELYKQIDKLQQENSNKDNTIQIKEQQIKELMKVVTNKDNQIKDLNQKIDQSESQITETISKEVLQRNLNMLNQEWKTKLQEMTSESAQKLNENQEIIQKKQKQIEKLEESYQFYKEFFDKNQNNQEVERQKQINKQLQQDLQNCKDETIILQNKLQNQKQLIDKLQQETIEQMTEIQKKDAQLEIKNNQIETLKNNQVSNDDEVVVVEENSNNNLLNPSSFKKNQQQSLGDEINNDGIFMNQSFFNNRQSMLFQESQIEINNDTQEVHENQVSLFKEKIKELTNENEKLKKLNQENKNIINKQMKTPKKTSLDSSNNNSNNSNFKIEQQLTPNIVVQSPIKEQQQQEDQEQQNEIIQQLQEELDQQQEKKREEIQKINLQFQQEINTLKIQIESQKKDSLYMKDYIQQQSDVYEEEISILVTSLTEMRLMLHQNQALNNFINKN